MWVLMGPYSCFCVLIGFSWSVWVVAVPYASLLVFMDLYKSLCVFMDLYKSLCVFMDSNGFL